ncbi:hypothetical protein P4114_15075 [Pseudomonas aeruginosa]|nr:hypothetical protein [Pseudomonas aeruginosa]
MLEMAFAGHCGVELNLDALADSREELAAVLFSEEPGAVIQVREGATRKSSRSSAPPVSTTAWR